MARCHALCAVADMAHNATLIGPFIETQICQVTEGMDVGIPNVGPRLEGIVVVGGSFENQTLVLASLLDVKELSFKRMVVTHLVPDDAIKTSLTIRIAVVAMLVAVSCRFHPKRAFGMKKLNMRSFS